MKILRKYNWNPTFDLNYVVYALELIMIEAVTEIDLTEDSYKLA
jgi:hypothetical protein